MLDRLLANWQWRFSHRRRVALEALNRCHGLPLSFELDDAELEGMALLERDGLVTAGRTASITHWNLTEQGKRVIAHV